MWMIRARRDSEDVEDFLREGLVGISDGGIGAVAPTITREQLLTLFAQEVPQVQERRRASWARQVLRFLTEVNVGDHVITYDRDRRRYLIGKISGEYRSAGNEAKTAHVRATSWTGEAPRESLSVATQTALGSVLTVFRLRQEVAEDLLANARSISATNADASPRRRDTTAEADEFAVLSEDTHARSIELTEDLISSLSWHEMQHVVAGLLRAMGYRTTPWEGGPGRGVDVFASPDGLGLEEPQIFVKVSHRAAPMESADIRSFIGGRRKDDKCLYVSTSGFSKDAQDEADRAEVALQLITLSKLRQLVVDNYEKLDPETRSLVPLFRLYWPVPHERD